MYKIKWRNRNRSSVVVTGISRYTLPQAERQVSIWQGHFPKNDYYIEKR